MALSRRTRILSALAWGSTRTCEPEEGCGYVDKTGTYVVHLPSPVKEDFASAWGDFSDGLSRWLFGTKYGFIDRTGKTAIPPQFDLTFGFSVGLAAVQVGTKWGYIETSGKMVIEPRELSSSKPFHNGLAEVVTRDGKWGISTDKATSSGLPCF